MMAITAPGKPVSAQSDEQRLLLIDGLNIVRRVYEANPQPDSREKVEGTVKSSLGSFKRALNEIAPTHVLVAFDYGGQTWRHRLYPAYRANRKPMPQLLRDALPDLYEQLAERFGVAVASIPDVEADDVIATCFSRWACAKTGPAVVMSTDKDLAWLMTQGALIRDHFTPEWRDAEWAERKFGIPPALILDFLALMGDDVDGVPGLDGVGKVTAAKWLLAYQSLDGVLESAGTIKGKVGERLREKTETVRLSRQLVSLKTDVQCGLTWNALRLGAGKNHAAPQLAQTA
ncbi:5'-3' exonuclease H3TH domain-containing protein [Trinickia sp. EG282A]|uniref:5'-3' exonuclease n=1 Tax=Trinickia sp. EG282A TaxID=3237013 RepID=UPI0034D31401